MSCDFKTANVSLSPTGSSQVTICDIENCQSYLQPRWRNLSLLHYFVVIFFSVVIQMSFWLLELLVLVLSIPGVGESVFRQSFEEEYAVPRTSYRILFSLCLAADVFWKLFWDVYWKGWRGWTKNEENPTYVQIDAWSKCFSDMQNYSSWLFFRRVMNSLNGFERLTFQMVRKSNGWRRLITTRFILFFMVVATLNDAIFLDYTPPSPSIQSGAVLFLLVKAIAYVLDFCSKLIALTYFLVWRRTMEAKLGISLNDFLVGIIQYRYALINCFSYFHLAPKYFFRSC